MEDYYLLLYTTVFRFLSLSPLGITSFENLTEVIQKFQQTGSHHDKQDVLDTILILFAEMATFTIKMLSL